MIGLLGCYRANSASVDVATMLASVPETLSAETVAAKGGAFARIAHGSGRSGSIERDGNLSVLVCGEIFNLEKFDDLDAASDSAAALLLSLAKHDRLDRLAAVNGQFSAVIYDCADRRLRLITDRLATFPLHYWQGPDELVFATHLYTLIAHSSVPCRADGEALAQLFTMQRTIGRTTPLADIAAMPAATILEFNASGRRERRYWDLTWRKRDFSLDEGAELLADAMRGAVARQRRRRVQVLLERA